MCQVTTIIVENIIVIEVKVDELHEGKILSKPPMSMTIFAVAQENKKNNDKLRLKLCQAQDHLKLS